MIQNKELENKEVRKNYIKNDKIKSEKYINFLKELYFLKYLSFGCLFLVVYFLFLKNFPNNNTDISFIFVNYLLLLSSLYYLLLFQIKFLIFIYNYSFKLEVNNENN